jgi:hypothetical protein
VRIGLEDGLEEALQPWFDTGEIGTPLYYTRFRQRWPERVSTALQAVVDAGPGVLIHCSKGCDRTGMLVSLVRSLLGEPREPVVADYLRTGDRLSVQGVQLGIHDDNALIDAVMATAGCSLEQALLDFLASALPAVEPFGEPLQRAFLSAGPSVGRVPPLVG